MGEFLTCLVAIFVNDVGRYLSGINAEEDKVCLSAKHLVGGAKHLGGGRAVDKVFAGEAGGSVGAVDGRFPFRVGGDM